MADGAHLLRLERAANLEHDRGGRLDLVAREQRTLRHHQMHARGLHPVERANGACELAFERAQVVDILHEAGRAERVRFVEDLVADAAALGQAALGKPHAQPRHAVLRDHDDATVVAQLVGNALALQLLHDRGGVLEGEIGKQRRHLRRGHAQHQEGKKADERNSDGAHRGNARGAERPDELDETFHRAVSLAERATRLARQYLPGL